MSGETSLGRLKFKYKEYTLTELKKGEWVDVFNDITFENGSTVEQISVCYNFNTNRPTIEIYFEEDEGGLHNNMEELLNIALNNK